MRLPDLTLVRLVSAFGLFGLRRQSLGVAADFTCKCRCRLHLQVLLQTSLASVAADFTHSDDAALQKKRNTWTATVAIAFETDSLSKGCTSTIPGHSQSATSVRHRGHMHLLERRERLQRLGNLQV
jgi:hypothetical protein